MCSPRMLLYSPPPHLAKKRLWQKLTHNTFLLDIHNGHQYIIKSLKSYSLNKPTNCNLSWSNLLDLGNLLTVSIILRNNYSKKYIWEMCTLMISEFSTSRKIVTVHHCFYGMKSWQWTFCAVYIGTKGKILYMRQCKNWVQTPKSFL